MTGAYQLGNGPLRRGDALLRPLSDGARRRARVAQWFPTTGLKTRKDFRQDV